MLPLVPGGLVDSHQAAAAVDRLSKEQHALVGQGVAYSCFTVADKSVGTAYGLITAIQNSGLAAFPLVVAALRVHAGGNCIPTVEIFFTCCAAGVVVGLFFNIMDAKRGGKLNANGKEQAGAGEDAQMEKQDKIMQEERANGWAPGTKARGAVEVWGKGMGVWCGVLK